MTNLLLPFLLVEVIFVYPNYVITAHNSTCVLSINGSSKKFQRFQEKFSEKLRVCFFSFFSQLTHFEQAEIGTAERSI